MEVGREENVFSIGIKTFVLLIVLVGTLSIVFAMTPDDDRHDVVLDGLLHETCAAGAAQVAHIAGRIERGDAGALGAARDLFTYGEPWLRLCGGSANLALADDAHVRAAVAAAQRSLAVWR